MPIRRIKNRIREKRSELRHKHPFKKFLFWATTSIATLFILGFFTLFTTIVVLSITLPKVTDLENLNTALSTQIYDRNGELLYAIHGEENREHVDYKEISKNIVNASVAIEDDQFWEHSGFDLPGIVRAGMYSVFKIGKPRGGSTITQQYIKNTFLSPERTYTRKVKELILAVKLEAHYDKEKIMELYLNRIPYGNNAYGVEKASHTYFQKSAKDLTIAQSAILAAIPKAPSYYNPLGPNKYSHLNRDFSAEEATEIKSASDLEEEEFRLGLMGNYISLNSQEKPAEINSEAEKSESEEEEKPSLEERKSQYKIPKNSIYLKGRADLVLDRMQELGFITEEEAFDARIEMQVTEFPPYRDPIKHPHFVFYVRELLEEKYGKEIVEQGGLKVTTSVDSELQTKAEKMLKEKAESNKERFSAENASLVAIDPTNGHILTMIGSADYFNEEIDGNVNVSIRKRQPGSSFKPFAYAQAFYNKYSPASVVYDVETRIGPDIPQNYDGEFEGPMSMRYALAQSRNIPAVKAYFLGGDQDPIIDLVTNMGISTLSKNFDYGYPLALGAGESKLLEMVSAYGVFANGGVRQEPISILKVENSNGDILEEWKEDEHKGKEVLDPQIAYLINSILSDTSVRLGGNLTVDGHVNAAKTGTSTDKNKKEGGEVRPRDLWTIGYTPNLVAGAWAGNNKPNEKPLNFNANGYDVAAPIWKAFMLEAVKGKTSTDFSKPEGIKEVEISTASGKLPSKYTPADMIKTEVFASFAVPEDTDDVYLQAEVDLISGIIIGEGCERELTELKTFMNHRAIQDRPNWTAGITKWIEDMQIKAKEEGRALDVTFGIVPDEECTAPTPEEKAKQPKIRITSPSKFQTIASPKIAIKKVPIEVEIDAPFGVNKVDFFFDDKFQNTTSESPYTGFIRIGKTMKIGSKHIVKVKIYDEKGFSDESSIEIKIGKTDKEGEESKEDSKNTDESETLPEEDDAQPPITEDTETLSIEEPPGGPIDENSLAKPIEKTEETVIDFESI